METNEQEAPDEVVDDLVTQRRAAIARRSYVPILKGKQGEQMALRDLAPAMRAAITPAFQLLPQRTDRQLGREFKQIAVAWAGVSTVLVDASWVDPAGTSQHPLIAASDAALANRLPMTPMVSPSSNTAYLAAARAVVAAHGQGAAIRLPPVGWAVGGAGPLLNALLAALRLTAQDVDLILDGGFIATDKTLDLYRAALTAGLPALPRRDSWRRVIVAAGSFPERLSDLPVGTLVRLPRHEWMLWNGLPATSRPIGYGDYGVGYPNSTDEMKNPRAIPLWAQFRYTVEDSFLVAKAGDINKSGEGEFYRVAGLIAAAADFDGASFSTGDAFISAMASGVGSPGNYSTWRRHGTVRHITKVVRLLATPVGP